MAQHLDPVGFSLRMCAISVYSTSSYARHTPIQPRRLRTPTPPIPTYSPCSPRGTLGGRGSPRFLRGTLPAVKCDGSAVPKREARSTVRICQQGGQQSNAMSLFCWNATDSQHNQIQFQSVHLPKPRGLFTRRCLTDGASGSKLTPEKFARLSSGAHCCGALG
ncbi:hypothetical protein T492DRAFT_1032781 [Pavlovales sp. CCMP2436]|nr:hypothetical protein T492DRAFT_1032781 [Pavlovales sp. CCMP2436]